VRRFRIVNVFTVDGDRLSGNPLCVFEDGAGLTDAQMQALARQMNLSETTFLFSTAFLTAHAPRVGLPGSQSLTGRPSSFLTAHAPRPASAQVRIFTPTFEMPFAGHPTLGTAHVVRALRGGDAHALEMKVGTVHVTAQGDRWTLVAAQKPATRTSAPPGVLARMLGLDEHAVLDAPLWVDTGAEQLVIPLRSAADVAACKPDAALLAAHGFSEKRGAAMAYVWARVDERNVLARFFFLVHGGVVEDPATGSACANLGGWHLAMHQHLPVELTVSQGALVGRPSRLFLRVGEDERIHVGGDVIELGAGVVSL
jgi:PhzF family phenazine biosynthesis protein